MYMGVTGSEYVGMDSGRKLISLLKPVLQVARLFCIDLLGVYWRTAV